MSYLLILLGLVALFFGGDYLVKGAVGLAKKFNVSTLVIGLTVVSIGTSAPELLVSLKAALTGVPDIAIGNVVGSNIANLALVLGISALIFPFAVSRNVARIDIPVMLVATLLFWYFISDLLLSWQEGLILVVLLIFYTIFLFINSKRQEKTEEEKEEANKQSFFASLGFVIAGSVALVFGADWLVTGASEVARELGVSDHIIGVTIVAFGTSVPELVTSITAAIRKETDISIGNLVGSNIFNICAILGITSLVTEIPVNPIVLKMDIFWVFGISLMILPFVLHKFKIHRFKAAIFLVSYFVYLYFVFLAR